MLHTVTEKMRGHFFLSYLVWSRGIGRVCLKRKKKIAREKMRCGGFKAQARRAEH